MRSTTAKLLDRMTLLLATIILAGRQYDIPSARFWVTLLKGRGYVVILLILIIGIFGAFTPFEAAAARSRVERKTLIRQQILIHFGRMLGIAAHASPPVEADDLGLHVWRIRRSLRHPLAGRLVRAATYRLGATPATRSFAPPKGVGVVGLCWKRNEEVHVDVAALALALPTDAEYAAFRGTNGPDSVMGLSWEEFVRVRHRGAVFASPIRNGRGAFIGCISVDAKQSYAALANSKEFWHEINTLCALLGQDRFQNV